MTPWTGESVRPSAQAPLTAQRAPNCVQQASETAMVCWGGGKEMALADTDKEP